MPSFSASQRIRVSIQVFSQVFRGHFIADTDRTSRPHKPLKGIGTGGGGKRLGPSRSASFRAAQPTLQGGAAIARATGKSQTGGWIDLLRCIRLMALARQYLPA